MMHTTTRLRIAAPALIAIGVTVTAATPSGPAANALRQFDQRIAAYMTLHQRVEAKLPSLQVTSDVRQMRRAVDAMAQAMRAERASAKAGDIFTTEAGAVLKARIRDVLLWTQGASAADWLAAINDESPYGETPPSVNDPFGFFAMTPSLILNVLPPLPDELQYRIVGSDLILVDIHSGLVVDILPQALTVN